MAQRFVIGGMLYGFLVFLLSILLVKTHLINKPVFKRGFLSGALFVLGSVFGIVGVNVLSYSKVLGIILLLIGIPIDIIKISSDIINAKNLKENNKPYRDGKQKVNNDSLSPEIESHEVNDASSDGIENAQYYNHLQTLKVVHFRFVYPYMTLYICISICILFLIFSVIVTLMEITHDKAKIDTITSLLKFILSFDFENKALQVTSGTQGHALSAAYAIASGIALLMLITVFGLMMKILKKRSIRTIGVRPLLVGCKHDFIPCSEGIYKARYGNKIFGNRFYCLYPWDRLSLYATDDMRNKVVLKAGKVYMPLIPGDRNAEQYSALKSAVCRHLPEERQHLPNRDHYGWGRVAIAGIIIIVLIASLASWFESASVKGNKYCDFKGDVHGNRTALSRNVPALVVYISNNKILHRYCYFHASFYLLIHPSEYIRSFSRMVIDVPRQKDDILIVEWLIVPPAIWFCLFIGALCAGKRLSYRISRL
jgi:hypothetical protein